MGEIHEVFVLALSLVWFAGATPDSRAENTMTATGVTELYTSSPSRFSTMFFKSFGISSLSYTGKLMKKGTSNKRETAETAP